MKTFHCDNCKKNIVKKGGGWLKTAFQTGTNNQGKIGTWCSRKCRKEYRIRKYRDCKIRVGFNQLGMPIFYCLVHGKPNSKYHRAGSKCYEKLAEKLNNLLS